MTILRSLQRQFSIFWQLRVNSLFPSRDIVVEIGEEIMGEEGLTVTLYQKKKVSLSDAKKYYSKDV